MGLLDLFTKPEPTLQRLPAGSLSVDRDGNILASTVPSGFQDEMVRAIVRSVLATFESAAQTQLPLVELRVSYPSFRITARALRGGAILFLAPQTPYAPTKLS
jgi:hypothetical protein